MPTSPFNPPPAYDPSAWEVDERIPKGLHRWHPPDIRAEFERRLAYELACTEVVVRYYRIGYNLSFPLPLAYRPLDTPAGWPGFHHYPWLIWLAWRLEERWRILHRAWRDDGHEVAGRLLQQEIAALNRWDGFTDEKGSVSLVTGHLAACLSLVLTATSGWDEAALQSALGTAHRLLDEDVLPWHEAEWVSKASLRPLDLRNIPVIALIRSAHLAAVIDHPQAAALEAAARRAFAAWCRFRLGPEQHTEGTAYDGYLLQAIVDWILSLPDREEVLVKAASALDTLRHDWLHLTLPGRTDLHAPVGDVEPEMTFWTVPLYRLAAWYGWTDAVWLLRRIPPVRLPAAALVLALDSQGDSEHEPRPGAVEHRHAVSMRTGWASHDILVTVGLSRCNMSHLHHDGGHITFGWQNRFWITDPGYQQYRPGAERVYTLGPAAHNAPVIGHVAQDVRASELLHVDQDADGTMHCRIHLSRCYDALPARASVLRDVWLIPDNGRNAVVRDTLAGLPADTTIQWSWHAGTHLAWAFREGWARLSDGRRAVWFGCSPGGFEAAHLQRVEGTRGPLTLTYRATLTGGEGTFWWFIVTDPEGGWDVPEEQRKRLLALVGQM